MSVWAAMEPGMWAFLSIFPLMLVWVAWTFRKKCLVGRLLNEACQRDVSRDGRTVTCSLAGFCQQGKLPVIRFYVAVARAAPEAGVVTGVVVTG